MGADGGLVYEWSVPEHSKLSDREREVSAAAISGDGSRLATAHAAVGSSVRIWGIE